MGLINIWHVKELYEHVGRLIEEPKYLGSVGWWIKFWSLLFSIKEFRIMLTGYKTYIVAALMGAVQVAKMLGYITPEIADELMKLLGAGAIATVSAKLNRMISSSGPNIIQ